MNHRPPQRLVVLCTWCSLDDGKYTRRPSFIVRVLALRFREQLEAGPGAVNLRERCPFYYEVCLLPACVGYIHEYTGRPARRREGGLTGSVQREDRGGGGAMITAEQAGQR